MNAQVEALSNHLRNRCEKRGVDGIRSDLALGACSGWEEFARSWLAEQDAKVASKAAEKRDAREEETLSIARKASTRADRANLIAWIAVALAAAAIAKDIVIAIFRPT